MCCTGNLLAGPVVLKDLAFYTAGATALSVSVTIRAMNISDDRLPSSVIVGMFPLSVVQANTPTATGVAETTDAESSYVRSCIPTNGIAYITGQPAAPQLTAQIKGLPDWIDVTWSGSLTTERPERNTLDNRTLQSMTLGGDEPYPIAEALSGEIVGGSVSLQADVSGGATISHPFKIRGKNPLDATARAYIEANVDAEFRDFAWMIAKHESKSGNRVFNQFNPEGNSMELPNKTAGANRWGWGMCQIDRGELGDATEEVYDWHMSVASMNVILRDKRNEYLSFIRLYRNVYGNNTNWVEPTNCATNVNGISVSAEVWGVLTLYNGKGGIPYQTIGPFVNQRSPLEFNPNTGRWMFHTNRNDYVVRVMNDYNGAETE